jgi:hypothetical protein
MSAKKTVTRDPRERGRVLSLQVQHLQAQVDAIVPRLAAAAADEAIDATARALSDAGAEPATPDADLTPQNTDALRHQLIVMKGEVASLQQAPR